MSTQSMNNSRLQRSLLSLFAAPLQRTLSNASKYKTPPPIELKSVRSRQRERDNSESDRNSAFSSGSKPIALAFLSIPIVTLGLGIWQIRRRKEKLALIDFLNQRTESAPIDLPTEPTELKKLLETSEYCPFRVKGFFLHSKEVLISPKSDLTGSVHLPGALVVTPFVLTAKPNVSILVNRGFVPYTHYLPTTRTSSQVESETELIGLLRSNEVKNYFSPPNNPPTEFHTRDIDLLAATLGTEPIFLDVIAPLQPDVLRVEGAPIPGQTAINLRNEHMGFIITWFSLSALTSVLWWTRYAKVLF